MLPGIGYSYAPCGQRPVIEADSKNRLKLSLSVVITGQGEMYYQVRQSSFNGAAIVRFIKKMKKTFRKKIILIWDGARWIPGQARWSTIHTCRQVKEYLQTQEEQNRKIWLEKLPPYSPELNPAEQVWAYLKNVLLKNDVSKTLAELKLKVVKAMEIIKNDKELIQSFFRHANTYFYANSTA